MPLRHASVALHNTTYEALLCSFFDHESEYLEQQLNLITPPLYNVTGAECTSKRALRTTPGWRPAAISQLYPLVPGQHADDGGMA